jgi:hypothetical protein
MTFVLIEDDTYFGKNFKEYLNMINYIPTSEHKIYINFILNRYTISSLSNTPNEFILKQCKDTYSILNENDIYIFISTPSLNAIKPLSEMSPLAEAAYMCENYLKDKPNTKIFRPVSLVDVVDVRVKGLVDERDTLITRIMKVQPGGLIEIHGRGEQKRMYMTMIEACRALFEFVNYPAKLLNISELTSNFPIHIRTTVNIKVRDLVHYLSRAFGYKYLFITDPIRYQDMIQCRFNYPYSYYDTTRDIKYLSMCIERMRENMK